MKNPDKVGEKKIKQLDVGLSQMKHRLIASTTVRSYLRGLFVLVADCIYHCKPIPYRKMSARSGYMKLSLGLKKLV